MLPIVSSFEATFTTDTTDTSGFDINHESDTNDTEFMNKCKQELNQRLTNVIDQLYPKSTVPSKRL